MPVLVAAQIPELLALSIQVVAEVGLVKLLLRWTQLAAQAVPVS